MLAIVLMIACLAAGHIGTNAVPDSIRKIPIIGDAVVCRLSEETLKEVKEELQRAFDLRDYNSDGLIDAAEEQIFDKDGIDLGPLNLRVIDADYVGYFYLMDTDNDGKATFKEVYQQYMDSVHPECDLV